MQNLTLSESARHILQTTIGRQITQVVWDIDAIYLNTSAEQFRIGAEIQTPPSPAPDEYDEAACLTVAVETPTLAFSNQGEAGYWYKVIANDITILNVEIVRTGICMPAERIWPLATPAPADSLVTACDCGILISTHLGVLPAVQLENAFGFASWSELRWYSREEVLVHLGTQYEVLSLTH